jgi:hypothetical protein
MPVVHWHSSCMRRSSLAKALASNPVYTFLLRSPTRRITSPAAFQQWRRENRLDLNMALGSRISPLASKDRECWSQTVAPIVVLHLGSHGWYAATMHVCLPPPPTYIHVHRPRPEELIPTSTKNEEKHPTAKMHMPPHWSRLIFQLFTFEPHMLLVWRPLPNKLQNLSFLLVIKCQSIRVLQPASMSTL